MGSLPVRVESAPRRAGDPARLVAGNARIRADLGWTPQYPALESIIQHAWNWRQRNPNGYPTKTDPENPASGHRS